MTQITFKDLALSPAILQAIEEIGYVKTHHQSKLRQSQLYYLEKILLGKHKQEQEKTAAFMLPILEKIDPKNRNVQALVLCPTRELASPSS